MPEPRKLQCAGLMDYASSAFLAIRRPEGPVRRSLPIKHMPGDPSAPTQPFAVHERITPPLPLGCPGRYRRESAASVRASPGRTPKRR